MAIVANSSSLQNILDQTSLKWVFVGGKGGVGKTTTSCSLGVQLSKVRRNVLIVSTDPAHNLSDAFSQKFTKSPLLVNGFTNLYCMEIDPNVDINENLNVVNVANGGNDEDMPGGASFQSSINNLMKELTGNIPGIDELMSFSELMKHVQRMEFDVTVFDTAPTGHTLRLLSLPGSLEKLISKVYSFKDNIKPILASMRMMMGSQADGLNEDSILEKLDEVKSTVDAVQRRIHDPNETTFVCVCIPEFLSLFETERLVQELSRFEIDTHNIVVNQVLFGIHGESSDKINCKRCASRSIMQKKYLEQIEQLYEDDFTVVKTPLLNEEVRGVPKLKAFSEYLIRPFKDGDEIPSVLEGKK
jgi:arsenite/tail-anchored protein-transporting ATPase